MRFELTDKWYGNQPSKVLESTIYKMTYTFNIQTDRVTGARSLDLVEDEEDRKCQIICFTVPNNEDINMRGIYWITEAIESASKIYHRNYRYNGN